MLVVRLVIAIIGAIPSVFGRDAAGVLAPSDDMAGYGALESEVSRLAAFEDSNIKGMTLCTFFIKEPGTCHPRSIHKPCAYCKTRNYLKLGGFSFIKQQCPGKESFTPGYENYIWRLTDKKFSGGWRICVVEPDTLALIGQPEANGASDEAMQVSLGYDANGLPLRLTQAASGSIAPSGMLGFLLVIMYIYF